MHGAGAALGKPAAEMRIIERQIVAQHIEERGVRVGLDGVDLAVDVERKFLVHGAASPYARRRFRSGSSACAGASRCRSKRWRKYYSQSGGLGTRFARGIPA